MKFTDLFDIKQPIFTRNGESVTILAVGLNRNKSTVCGVVHAKEDQVFYWQPNGLWGDNEPHETHQLDLIPNRFPAAGNAGPEKLAA